MTCDKPMFWCMVWEIQCQTRIWPSASPFDLLSRFVRDFDIRQMSPYDFLDSSNHSASNDMRQAYVVMYGLRDTVPNSYLTTSPPMRGYITNFWPYLRCLPPSIQPIGSIQDISSETSRYVWNGYGVYSQLQYYGWKCQALSKGQT